MNLEDLLHKVHFQELLESFLEERVAVGGCLVSWNHSVSEVDEALRCSHPVTLLDVELLEWLTAVYPMSQLSPAGAGPGASWFVGVQSLSCVQLFATPWIAAWQTSFSFPISWSLLIFMSIELVMPSNHFILYHLLLLLPPIIPSIRVFSDESTLHIRWPFSSVQFSRSVMSDCLWPHELQHTRPPCPSPTPTVYSNSCPSSRWCHPAISSSLSPFSSCPQSLPASGSFPLSQLFAWGGQSNWSFSFSISPSNEHPGLISFRIDWLDLLAVPGDSQESSLTHSICQQIWKTQQWP